MILFYGVADDPPLALAIEAAAAGGHAHLVVDERNLHLIDLTLESRAGDIGGAITVGDTVSPLGGFTAVYARPLLDPSAAASSAAAERSSVFSALFLDWLEVAPCRVVSRPSAMTSNTSKPDQLRLLAALGFAVPPTLVSSDRAEIEAFAAVHGQVIFKSISSIRSIVRLLDAAGVARLDRVRSLPTQFQAYIPGTDVRVHVIGTEALAAEAVTEAIDYRYAAAAGIELAMAPITLPVELTRRCVDAAAALGLPFCGLDLRRTPSGEYFCLEANPMPGYSFYQQQTGLPIAQALVRYLAS